MTWKSTIVATGATALAGWLASLSSHPTAPSVAAPRSQAAQVATSSDIEEQAARLRTRLREETAFRQPSRDPFRFAAPLSQSQRRVEGPRVAEPSEAATAPSAPLLTLAGLATDIVDGAPRRTAILSAPDGVVLVGEGDTVAGLYRVGKVDDDGVDLIRVVDGQLLRLGLARSRP